MNLFLAQNATHNLLRNSLGNLFATPNISSPTSRSTHIEGTTSYTTIIIVMPIILATLLSPPTTAWSNGGYSADPSNPDYGTHDWIAEHALD